MKIKTFNTFLFQSKVTVHWNGWIDNDSGIDEYIFNVYTLEAKSMGGPLTNGRLLPERNASASQVSSYCKQQKHVL